MVLQHLLQHLKTLERQIFITLQIHEHFEQNWSELLYLCNHILKADDSLWLLALFSLPYSSAATPFIFTKHAIYYKLLYFVDQQHTNIYVKRSLAPAAVKHMFIFSQVRLFFVSYQEMRNYSHLNWVANFPRRNC